MTEVPPPGNRTPLGLLLYLEKKRVRCLAPGELGAPLYPEYPPLSTPRRGLRGGVPRPLGPPAPGTTTILREKKEKKNFAAEDQARRRARPSRHTLPLPGAAR